MYSFIGNEEVLSAVAVERFPFPGSLGYIRSGKAGLVERALGKSILVYEVSNLFMNDCEEWTGVIFKDLVLLDVLSQRLSAAFYLAANAIVITTTSVRWFLSQYL